MGLDMYLNAKRYVGYGEDELSDKVTEAAKSPFGPIKIVEAEAMYWRKSNAIHQWFVKNVQDDVDDCGEYDVDRSQLRELMETCQLVLADHKRAPELLPTQSGFFFGGTDYNEMYFADIESTATALEKLLSVPEPAGWYFVYTSSW
jgi:hypothetical protein